MNEMRRSTREREHDDDGPPMDMGPPPDYGPPATRDQAPTRQAAALAATLSSPAEPDPPRILEGTPQLTAAVSKAAGAIGWIEKRGHNKFHQYDYATIDDMRAAIAHTVCGDHGIEIHQDEAEVTISSDGRYVLVRYHFWLSHSSGEVGPVTNVRAMALLQTTKGFDDKAFSKASSLGFKDYIKRKFVVAAGEEPEPAGGDDDPDARGREEERRDDPPRGEARGRGPKDRLDAVAKRTKLKVPKAKTPDEWAANAIEMIGKIESTDDLNEMLNNERKFLDDLAADAPDLHGKVQSAVRDAQDRIMGGGK